MNSFVIVGRLKSKPKIAETAHSRSLVSYVIVTKHASGGREFKKTVRVETYSHGTRIDELAKELVPGMMVEALGEADADMVKEPNEPHATYALLRLIGWIRPFIMAEIAEVAEAV